MYRVTILSQSVKENMALQGLLLTTACIAIAALATNIGLHLNRIIMMTFQNEGDSVFLGRFAWQKQHRLSSAGSDHNDSAKLKKQKTLFFGLRFFWLPLI